MIILIGCNKGGAGKTTTVTNLAVALTRRGHEVCLVDADPQHNAANWHAEREKAGLSPAIVLCEKSGNITSTLKALDEKYEYVLVDVAGRNSRELITGMLAADILIAPHQCSQFDLDTLSELQEQVVRARDYNPGLKALVYHAMASPNPSVKDAERRDFVDYLGEFPEFGALRSVGFYRKAYRDVTPDGRSVLESDNALAISEVESLVDEVFGPVARQEALCG